MDLRTQVIDFYDDREGRILQGFVPDPSDLPPLVKTAAVLAESAHNNQYALVMSDQQRTLRRFPTNDVGNTWLSALYFHATHDVLPEEAEKVAAANLLLACNHFQIDPPQSLVEAASRHDGPPTTNLVDITGQRREIIKEAEALPEDDVVYALEDEKRYPLASAQDARTAMTYLDRHLRGFAPGQRREFATKVASVAERAGLPVEGAVAQYAGNDYSPGLQGHLTARAAYLVDIGATPKVRAELTKVAAQRTALPPDEFAAALQTFDESHGLDRLWDQGIADPYYSTFGWTVKTAADKTRYEAGILSVSEDELRSLAEYGRKVLVERFGEKLANAFCKNPVAIFTSMPLPQRQILANMASSVTDLQ